MRVGIFGGSFNPPHMGNLNSLQTVLKKTGLDKILVIPTAQNPLKSPIDGPTAQQRLEMVQEAIASYGGQLEADDREIKRGGLSYTIDTIMELRKTIGMDLFDQLESWKNIDQILKETNLIVTSRPGFDLPAEKDELPEFIQKYVSDYDFNFIELNTGRNIQFLSLKDIEISASDLRKWIRSGKNVEKFLPLAVESYVKKHNIFPPLKDRIGNYDKFTEFCGDVLFAKKGIQVRGFDLSKLSAPSEYALIASGTSTRHTSAIAENVIEAVKLEYNVFPLSIEGKDEGRWVLLDYGGLIIHVFYDFVRREYSLENMWREGRDMLLKDKSEPVK
jgi:nicotinate-nucleotide adenylyltransferase